MKTIKEIKIEDCVLCYVDMTTIPTKYSKKRLIIGLIEQLYIDTFATRWSYAIPCEELDNPPQPKWSDKYPKEWSIDAKIFKALSEGAILRNKDDDDTFNYWSNHRTYSIYQICTSYTGTDSDVWEEIE